MPRILCLHYIAEIGRAPRRLAVSIEALDAIVTRERAAGLRAGTLAEAVTDPSRFALTFDDAHQSLLTLAAPRLRALDVPGAVFVPTDYVGMSDEVLSWDELRALRDAGWTIGSHSRTHPRFSWRLYDEDAAAYQQRLDDEAARSREMLEAKLGITVPDFAFPYGESTPAARKAVARAGYERAFTVSETLAWDGDPLAIPRLEGMEAHGIVQIAKGGPTPISVIIPACNRKEMLTEILSRWSSQSYPIEAFEVVVVDDGSHTSLRPCLEGASPNVRLVEGAGVPGTFRAGAARQRGADEARYETLAFLDADVAVGPDFLWALDWIHRRVEGAVVIGYLSGYNLHDIGFTHSLADLQGAANPKDVLAIIPDRSREPTLRSCFDNLDWLDDPWRLAYTGNLSVNQSVLAAVGGFSRDFTGWGLEDLDLGYRLHRAGAPFVFSRFAVGYHLVDASESAPRNPFRAPAPTRSLFAGYEKNLATLATLHGGDRAVARFVEQARADIEETCGRPETVGVEMGGVGITIYELLDRLAYATKVGARALYLLGGEPVNHPAFLELLRRAKAAGIERITAETTPLPFTRGGLASEARAAGLNRAVLAIAAFDETTSLALDRLREAGIASSARLVVGFGRAADVPRLLAEIRAHDLALEAVVVVEDVARPEIERAVIEAGFPAQLLHARS